MANKTEKDPVVANEMERVYLPKEYKGDDDQYVSVNGKRYQVQKGKYVDVPVAVADVIHNSSLMTEKAQAYIDMMSV